MTSASALAAGGGKPLALTMGEPAGVGGEIALKAWLRRGGGLPPFLVIDDPARLQGLAESLGLAVPVGAIEAPEQAVDAFSQGLPVLAQPLAAEPVPGQPDPANAAAVCAAIERAVELVRSGRAAGVVTNPIHKKSLYRAGFEFPGHTEFLAHLAEIETLPVMMLACPELRTVPVTVHAALGAAVGSLDRGTIVETGKIVHAALVRDFAIERPRLAVAGLNPHAGEDGAMGAEEIEIIGPAIAELRRAGIDAFGPAPPDTLFAPRARATYDAALCMYHDQALIPIKALDFDGAVNVTLGLPFVRTSPDHGTGLDIAGSGRARETSLVAALGMAWEMAGRRAAAEG